MGPGRFPSCIGSSLYRPDKWPSPFERHTIRKTFHGNFRICRKCFDELFGWIPRCQSTCCEWNKASSSTGLHVWRQPWFWYDTFLDNQIDKDIRGANDYGWYSVLVRTGNFKGEGNSPLYPAKRVFDDVGQAVDWILGHEDRRYQNLLTAQQLEKEEIDEKDEGYYTE